MTKKRSQYMLEIGFWLIVLPVAWLLVAWSKLLGWVRYDAQVDYFRFTINEASSCAAALIMVWFVGWWLHRFPVSRGQIPSAVAGHLLGSILFTVGHLSLYVAIRVFAYSLYGLEYHWQAGYFYNLLYEYPKDLGVYSLLLLVIWTYRTQVADQWFSTTEIAIGPDTATSKTGNRLRVQTGRGEALLQLNEVVLLEAARNYVTIRTQDREYVVREPLKSLLARLPDNQFVRCHRSYVINLDHMTETISGADGGISAVLDNGTSVPVSRGFRAELDAAFQRIS